MELYHKIRGEINKGLDNFKDSESGLMREKFTVSIVQNQTETG